MVTTIGMIAFGGAVGAVARYGVNVGCVAMLGHSFPYGTMIVNILGSFLMGVAIAKFAEMQDVSQEMRSMVSTGFLGAFTTFSAFSLDFVTLWERGDVVHAFLYALLSVVLCVTALFLGLWLMRSFAG
ncbi:MAG: fluoride efflux transporter CrcB [Alphaproteobacteria bacterium]|nr:fluoride efflux transporter CrcB [Alphaproteobacteria bacterium]